MEPEFALDKQRIHLLDFTSAISEEREPHIIHFIMTTTANAATDAPISMASRILKSGGAHVGSFVAGKN